MILGHDIQFPVSKLITKSEGDLYWDIVLQTLTHYLNAAQYIPNICWSQTPIHLMSIYLLSCHPPVNCPTWMSDQICTLLFCDHTIFRDKSQLRSVQNDSISCHFCPVLLYGYNSDIANVHARYTLLKFTIVTGKVKPYLIALLPYLFIIFLYLFKWY